jgi:hypothetical protein
MKKQQLRLARASTMFGVKRCGGYNLSCEYFLGRNTTLFGARVNTDHESLRIRRRKTDVLMAVTICNRISQSETLDKVLLITI